MQIKLAVFDIDGTLAPTQEIISPKVGEKLRELQSRGLGMAFISGRTASYLAGLVRGMGLRKCYVAGENGGVIFEPLSKWERKLEAIPHQTGEELKKALLKKFPDLWFQPNQTMLTATPKDPAQVDSLYREVLHLKRAVENQSGEGVYKINKYDDSVEIMPQKNSKGVALAVIKEILNLKKEEVIVFGNTTVDLPMQAEAGKMIIIGENPRGEGIINYSGIEEALEYLKLIYFGQNISGHINPAGSGLGQRTGNTGSVADGIKARVPGF